MTSLREQVETLLPAWEQWYPSLFDAAEDLGVIRARVCSPGSLLLSSRHSAVQSAAAEAHREQWGGVLQDLPKPVAKAGAKPSRRQRRRSNGNAKK